MKFRYLKYIAERRTRHNLLCLSLIVIASVAYLCTSSDVRARIYSNYDQISSADYHGGHSNNTRIPQKIRLLCWLVADPNGLDTYSAAIKATWGKRCDKLIFMSKRDDKDLEAIDIGQRECRQCLWFKTLTSMRYLYDNYLNDYDWFFRADHDTFVMVENLRYLLTAYDPNLGIMLGERSKAHKGKPYLAGGPGYAISRKAVKMFIEEESPNGTICQKVRNTHADDVLLGACMGDIGVMMVDTRDEKAKNRMFQHKIEDYISGTHIRPRTFALYKYEKGIYSISETAISFHRMKSIPEIYALEFLIYKLQVYGFQRDNHMVIPAPLPPDVSTVPKEVLSRHPYLRNQSRQ